MTVPPVQAEYTPQGETITSGDLPIYISGDKYAASVVASSVLLACAHARLLLLVCTCALLLTRGGNARTHRFMRSHHHTAKASTTKGIVYVPDIFGVTPQAHQVCIWPI